MAGFALLAVSVVSVDQGHRQASCCWQDRHAMRWDGRGVAVVPKGAHGARAAPLPVPPRADVSVVSRGAPNCDSDMC